LAIKLITTKDLVWSVLFLEAASEFASHTFLRQSR